jgi:hypothetical protein
MALMGQQMIRPPVPQSIEYVSAGQVRADNLGGAEMVAAKAASVSTRTRSLFLMSIPPGGFRLALYVTPEIEGCASRGGRPRLYCGMSPEGVV